MKFVKIWFSFFLKHQKRKERKVGGKKKRKKDKDLNQISPQLDAKKPQFHYQNDQQQKLLTTISSMSKWPE